MTLTITKSKSIAHIKIPWTKLKSQLLSKENYGNSLNTFLFKQSIHSFGKGENKGSITLNIK